MRDVQMAHHVHAITSSGACPYGDRLHLEEGFSTRDLMANLESLNLYKFIKLLSVIAFCVVITRSPWAIAITITIDDIVVAKGQGQRR